MTHHEVTHTAGAIQYVNEDRIAGLIGMRPVIVKFAVALTFRRDCARRDDLANAASFQSGGEGIELAVVCVVFANLRRLERWAAMICGGRRFWRSNRTKAALFPPAAEKTRFSVWSQSAGSSAAS
jgi:hypothetical protein